MTVTAKSLNEGRSVNPGYTSATTSSIGNRSRAARTLNEGRSVNPGYTPSRTRQSRDAPFRTGPRSTKAGASTPATPLARVRSTFQQCRSTKAGAQPRSTKAGASTPANTGASTPATLRHHCDLHDTDAQRRPERQPRLHSGLMIAVNGSVQSASLNEGRSVNPGYTRTTDHANGAGGASTPVTAPTFPLNEGRSVNPGDTRHARSIVARRQHACGLAQRRPERQPRLHLQKEPASPIKRDRRLPMALNEGRSVNPGYTRR